MADITSNTAPGTSSSSSPPPHPQNEPFVSVKDGVVSIRIQSSKLPPSPSSSPSSAHHACDKPQDNTKRDSPPARDNKSNSKVTKKWHKEGDCDHDERTDRVVCKLESGSPHLSC